MRINSEISPFTEIRSNLSLINSEKDNNQQIKDNNIVIPDNDLEKTLLIKLKTSSQETANEAENYINSISEQNVKEKFIKAAYISVIYSKNPEMKKLIASTDNLIKNGVPEETLTSFFNSVEKLSVNSDSQTIDKFLSTINNRNFKKLDTDQISIITETAEKLSSRNSDKEYLSAFLDTTNLIVNNFSRKTLNNYLSLIENNGISNTKEYIPDLSFAINNFSENEKMINKITDTVNELISFKAVDKNIMNNFIKELGKGNIQNVNITKMLDTVNKVVNSLQSSVENKIRYEAVEKITNIKSETNQSDIQLPQEKEKINSSSINALISFVSLGLSGEGILKVNIVDQYGNTIDSKEISRIKSSEYIFNKFHFSSNTITVKINTPKISIPEKNTSNEPEIKIDPYDFIYQNAEVLAGKIFNSES